MYVGTMMNSHENPLLKKEGGSKHTQDRRTVIELEIQRTFSNK